MAARDRPDPYAFEALWRQYRACRRNKRATVNALRFELNAEANLLALQQELRDHTYRPGASICFVTGGPKPREVFAADFRDRVVHHLLVSWQEPLFEREFIHDSYACRKGKGTLAASDRLTAFLRQATANGRRPAGAMHLDVASFFPSIRKETLSELIAARFRDPEVRWLTQTVLFHDPTQHYRYRTRNGRTPGPGSPRYPVPARKSLFGAANARGLPIGNLTSQFWGNVYLNELDHFVKRRLGVRWYVRYVDDLVLLDAKVERLRAWRAAIAEFLAERLGLALRVDRGRPAPVRTGIDFVGWKTWWNRRLPRRRTVRALHARVAEFARRQTTPLLCGRARRVAWRDGPITALRASLASYAGHVQHGASWREWERVWTEADWLAVCFARSGWRVAPRWPVGLSAAARPFGVRYARLVRGAGGHALVFCQVGRYVEFRGAQRPLAERVLGLRRVVLPRGGCLFAAGFPLGVLGRYLARAVAAGVVVALAPAASGCAAAGVAAVIVPTRRSTGTRSSPRRASS